MADASQEVSPDRDAELLQDVDREVVLVDGCVGDPRSPLFSPKEGQQDRDPAMQSKRQSKVPPGDRNRPVRQERLIDKSECSDIFE